MEKRLGTAWCSNISYLLNSSDVVPICMGEGTKTHFHSSLTLDPFSALVICLDASQWEPHTGRWANVSEVSRRQCLQSSWVSRTCHCSRETHQLKQDKHACSFVPKETHSDKVILCNYLEISDQGQRDCECQILRSVSRLPETWFSIDCNFQVPLIR